MKLKKLLFLTVLGLTASATFTSCEDILGHWEKPTPVTPTPSDSETPSEPEEESVPGLLTGKFTINSAGNQVQFSRGNLQAKIASYSSNVAIASAWQFAANQYDCIGNAAGNNSFAVDSWVDLFSWVGTSAGNDTYGLITFNSNSQANHGNDATEVLKTDWGTAAASSIGTGWRTLTKDEWNYLFNETTRTDTRYCKATVNGKSGVVLFPDSYTHPADGGTVPASVNTANAEFGTNTWTAAQWTAMETAGAVFLPVTGERSGTSVSYAVSSARYWSSTAYSDVDAYYVSFNSSNLSPADGGSRFNGHSVRLVRPVD